MFTIQTVRAFVAVRNPDGSFRLTYQTVGVEMRRFS